MAAHPHKPANEPVEGPHAPVDGARAAAGPAGSSPSPPANTPLILVALGFVAVFVSVAAESPWPAVAGVLLILVGGIWGGIRSEGRRPEGVGPAVAASAAVGAGEGGATAAGAGGAGASNLGATGAGASDLDGAGASDVGVAESDPAADREPAGRDSRLADGPADREH